MAKTLVPAEFKTHIIDQLIESITERANTSYYAFVGDHESVASTLEEVNPPLETIKKLNSDVFRNMIFGKRLSNTDIKFVVNRNDWVEGTTYEMYDDETIELQDKNFYIAVDEDSYKHVYKCLYNANNSPSTIKPLFEDAKYDANLYVPGDDYYETSDGYQWKYMYSITSTEFTKFATEKFMPVTANTAVQDNAIEGSIDVIKVITHGKNYQNHLSGKFEVADLNRISASIAAIYNLTNANRCYRLEVGADQTENFYKNTMMYLTSGVGSGQYRKVIRSIEIPDIGGVFVELEDNFLTIPDETTTYELSPAVEIIGDGTQTTNAVARAIINATASDSVHKIEMLDVGANYSYSTARVLTGSPRQVNGLSVVVTPAEIRPIASPQGGHGANTVVEFGAKRISFSTRFNRGESGLVEPVNTFGQFGIIRNPQFANVAIYTENVSGGFIEGETICQFTKLQLGDQASWMANSVVGNFMLDQSGLSSNEYGRHFKSGDYVYIVTNDGVNPTHLLTTVGNASNSTAIHLSEATNFTDGTLCTVYYVHKQAEATVRNVNPPFPLTNTPATGMLVDDCTPEFRKGSTIYGLQSKNIATIKGIDINNRINDGNADFIFNNFRQTIKIIGSAISNGPFEEDETVTQGSATAQVHSIQGNNIYLTNIVGDFSTIGDIVGSSSGAIMSGIVGNELDIVYGDLDPNSGSVIYIQNDIPVDREENQTEEIRVILEF